MILLSLFIYIISRYYININIIDTNRNINAVINIDTNVMHADIPTLIVDSRQCMIEVSAV